MPSNSIAFARNYTTILDEVYQRAGVSNALNSGRRMVRAGRNAKEVMIPKISVTGAYAHRHTRSTLSNQAPRTLTLNPLSRT